MNPFSTSTLVLVACVSVSAAESVQFNRDIRPILSDKCFQCHGPDANKRQAELRLDMRDAAIESGAIAPGSPAKSELIRRIMSEDSDERMPPDSAKLGRLTVQEKELIRLWIEQGAEFQNHWSFLPVQPVTTPASTSSEIDKAVAAGLERRGLARQPEGDRPTLIRRLTFDLTGLPPTPAEVEEFCADNSTNAYEKVVDRLLASNHYGERMAVDWLDTARYADSYGFQVDREREVYPWRDWVVRSFNSNQPFHEFITWQLAGDLLPNATDDQILATAFNRMHQQETEGGSVEEEYRVEYVCDRVQTFATTFLGLTFECARCHDHKYDPIRQREYYQLFAMFQNIDEAGLYSYFTQSPPTPTLLLADGNAKGRMSELGLKVQELENLSASQRSARRPAFQAWLTDLATKLRSQNETELGALERSFTSAMAELGQFSFDSVENGKLSNSIKSDQPASLKGENKVVAGKIGNAIQFTGDDAVDLPIGNFARHEPFSVSLWMKTPDVKSRAVVFHRSRAWTDAASRGYELLLEDGRLKWSLIHFWPGNAISIQTEQPLPVGEWQHVTVTSDGSSRANGLNIYVNGVQNATQVVRDNLTKEINGGGGDNIALGERFRDRGFQNGLIDEFRVYQRELTQLEVLAISQAARVCDVLANHLSVANNVEPPKNGLSQSRATELLYEYYLAAVDSEWRQRLHELQESRGIYTKFIDALKEIMVMRELPQPKQAYVLFRGEYNQRRDEVQPGTPQALSPFPENAPKNRLGLAAWLTNPKHPLTARVTVNRIWQGLFGRGLVKTAEDFGSQGARPLYPEVLDLLAWRFMESGWNVKSLVKAIVMSQTYRQRSMADPKVMSDDPDNEWLARGPRFRLPAEMIRDNALAAAGLLDRQLGGPPVNPYEMSDSFKPATPTAGSGVFRRSLYTNWRRTGPPPAMLAFDAPRRAVCIARRERTDSPLQALILLNGEQYVEAARVLGESLYRESKGNADQMIERGFLRCLSRMPDPKERQILADLYKSQVAYFGERPTYAEELLKVGRTPRESEIPLAQAAAAAILAQALLNHDACVTKR